MGRSEDYTSDDPTLNPPIVEGQANPMRRDTVEVPSGTSVTLRVVADNPGAWFFHCTFVHELLYTHKFTVSVYQATSSGI